MNAATFGLWLKERRNVLGLTQEELGARIGCSPDSVRKFEAGTRRPSRQIADLLAQYFNVPTDEMELFARFARDQGPGIRAQSSTPTDAPWRALAQPHPTTYLPTPPTSLIGREREVAQARNLLWRANARLVTLTGPPGIGKTRLGLEVAAALEDDFEDGLLFLPLTSITDPQLVVSTLAQALCVKETPDRPLLASLQEHLRSKQMLLVLDNFEQIVEAAPVVSALLSAAPRLKVLVTSRIPLHLRGEKVISVPPLAVPDPHRISSVEELAQVEGVALFVERAQDNQPDFILDAGNAPDVAAICARLDGLPLAIELAAAKLRLLTPRDLLAHMEQRLMALTGGPRDAPLHQQTLRGAIESSYDLLSIEAREHFRRLSVFASAFSPDEAHVVADVCLDALASLVDQSLLRREPAPATKDGEYKARFTMLETIREYALEKLAESGELDFLRKRHLDFYMALAKAADLERAGPSQGFRQNRLEESRDDLRAALRWARESRHVDMALRMSEALGRFWFNRGYVSEGRDELEATLSISEGLDNIDRARVQYYMAEIASAQDDYTAQRHFYLESLATARRLGGDTDSRKVICDALRGVVVLAIRDGNYTLARQYGEERLATYRDLDDQDGIASSLTNLGYVAFEEGNYQLAHRLWAEGLDIARKLSLTNRIVNLSINMGGVARAQGDYVSARSFYTESLAICQELGAKVGIANCLRSLGYVAQQEGVYGDALNYFEESLALYQEQGSTGKMAECLAGISGVWSAQGYPERAARLLGVAESLISSVGYQLESLDQADYKRNLDLTRSMLNENAFALAYTEGAAMSLDDAIAYARGFSFAV